MPTTSKSAWHGALTVDIVLVAACKTIFHPFVAWMVPLSLRAVAVPYSDFSFTLSVAYAALLTLLSVFSAINNRVAYGVARDVDLSDEVIVITGGSSGLGRLVADFYAMRGAAVAVLDVKKVEEKDAMGLAFYECDIGDAGSVKKAAERIRADLGIPTILINNAAIVHRKSLLEQTSAEAEKSIRVNLLSHFHTIHTFLPDMLTQGHGTVVTVASVLGYLGCANLSSYTSAKAGLLALHASLRAELAYSTHPNARNIKTILVAPGQLDTGLFAGLTTPSAFLAPVVPPVELAREIVDLVDAGRSGDICRPVYTRFVPLVPALPAGVQRVVRAWSGVDAAAVMSKKASG
ncbi:NAD(P)-binding protein [Trichodelitschia bisporula]|uniref:NAD(P)-binding protein n=1 Tax=Trichodelitschia bisporula TaxID=703511 RepID=A0A6G1I6B3_9PEZI|nr:NAD(P)-binding protein [Trichodelitschia bisporula]